MNRLNFLTFVFLTLTLVSIFSCSKDDEADDPILGTWEYKESIEGFSMTVTMTFNADHTGIAKSTIVFAGESESETSSFTYSTNGSQLTLTSEGESSVTTYSISGNKLTITEDGMQMVFTRI